MAFTSIFTLPEPARGDVDARLGRLVLEFGTPWCGFCRAAQGLIAGAFACHPDLPHLKIEDGKGMKLGRSFRVQLWPTLVFLRDGVELARLVRPQAAQEIRDALAQIGAPKSSPPPAAD